MNATQQRQLSPYLIGLGVLLAAAWLLLLSGFGTSAHWDPPRAVTPLPVATDAASLPTPVPLQQYALVWQKPLFSPDRRPVTRVADGGSSLGDLTLTGVILTRDLHMALLHDRKGDRELRLRVGERMPDGSVTLVEVRARSALFDAPSGRTELKLPPGAPIDTAAAPASAATMSPNANPADASDDAPPTRATNPRRRDDASAVMSARPAQPVLPTEANGQSSSTAIQRLRETINKRRAAQAAAAEEGVR